MAFEDSKILLQDAESLLKEIEYLHSIDLEKGYTSPLLKVRIKQYLDNICASLDYAAYAIFSDYCADHVPPEELEWKRRNVYFTIEQNQTEFYKKIKRRFPKLIEEQTVVVEVFKKYQPFPTRPKWLYYLKTLCNNNKHRYLSDAAKQTHTEIRNLKGPGGLSISGITIVAPGNTNAVAYGDMPLNLENPNNLPHGVIFDGSVTKDFFFTEIDQPVLKTLKRIYRSAPTIISDLEKVMEGG